MAMAKKKETARKPFHESIVEAIRMASSMDLTFIGVVLMATVIPQGHDEIAGAWMKRCAEMRWHPANTALVAHDILQQKDDLQKAKAAKAEEKGGESNTTQEHARYFSLTDKVVWDKMKYPDLAKRMVANYGEGPFKVVGLQCGPDPYPTVTIELTDGTPKPFTGSWFQKI